MAIVLTNGKHYIATDHKGGIIKTLILEEAQIFYNVNAAMRKVRKAPVKCKGYYPYDTEDVSGYSPKKKRKSYTKEERKLIYDKSKGRCVLCGKRLTLENMILDHIIPLSMGGEESMDNLQATCYADNQFKNNILSEAFIDRIVKIFLYQTKKNCSKELKRKIIYSLLESL